MTFISALIPIMMLIVLGFILKRSRFLPENTWAGIEKLTYYILFPALLIKTLAQQSLSGVPWLSMLFVVFFTLLACTFVLIIFRKKLTKSDATFTSIFQGGLRFNTYIMLAISQSLYGAVGLAMGSVVAGFMIVLINLCCITVFAIWGKTAFQGAGQFIKAIIANPLIIGCAIGWFLSISGIGLPLLAENTLAVVARAALPLGLLAVGAALKLESIRGHVSAIMIASMTQFIIKPIITISLIAYTGLTGIAAAVLIIAFMTPTAPSAYILARQLGGDTDTMASIITMQTLAAFLIMPVLGALLL
ncbi:transporter [Psychromonas marina]|uniref:Transporter n=1 Tax=Psychromonas marina TaxID=88364 RepID=A0ABQ6E4R7_9GAMM|nr:AEC family transporter [Psychromonas marina]GLS92399.1 transporter [Psychromonas marina]